MYKKITPKEFFDIRSKNDVKSRIEELNKKKPIAVICRSGLRSAEIAKFLVSRSFADVANIEGGINEWSDTVDKKIQKY